MTKLREIYKCNVCGNVCEIEVVGGGNLVCCGQPMELLQAKNENEGKEKHIPVVESTMTGIVVKVGSIPHPMTSEHGIRFIEVLTKNQVLRAELPTDGPPEAEFLVDADDVIAVREFCNIHGLWKNV